MPYTTRQHMEARIAAAYGYTLNGVPLDEFAPGDGIIVLTQKGEPVVTGQVEELRFGVEEEKDVPVSCRVGDMWYGKDQYLFRVM